MCLHVLSGKNLKAKREKNSFRLKFVFLSAIIYSIYMTKRVKVSNGGVFYVDKIFIRKF